MTLCMAFLAALAFLAKPIFSRPLAPPFILAWSLWRRQHQAKATHATIRAKSIRNCRFVES